jgi:hypothetical protein
METKTFIRKAMEQGFVYEKKQLRSGWTSVEVLPVHWFHGLYTYRRTRLTDGTLVEQPVDLDESEFGKSLLLSV